MQSGKFRVTGTFHGITATIPCIADGWTDDGRTRCILTGDADKAICPVSGCTCPDGIRLYTYGEFLADSGSEAQPAVVVDHI